jgi:hypothetical protein
VLEGVQRWVMRRRWLLLKMYVLSLHSLGSPQIRSSTDEDAERRVGRQGAGVGWIKSDEDGILRRLTG